MTKQDFFEKHSLFVEAMLALDLGNSRTGWVVVDGLNLENAGADDAMKPRFPAFAWNDAGDGFKVVAGGKPFQSSASCIVPRRGGPLSFLKLGEQSRYNTEQKMLDAKFQELSISSPKRYFYEQEADSKNRNPWCARDYEKDDNAALSGAFAEAMARRIGMDSPERLPRGAFIGAMVAELFEQALRHVNSRNFKEETNNPNPRWISAIHVTYPSAFSQEERRRYLLQIEKGVAVFMALFKKDAGAANAAFDFDYNAQASQINADLPPVEILSDVDEASAVFSYFVANEIRGSSLPASEWLSDFGRKNAFGKNVCRLAAIDIGGGTSDLAVADISELSGNNYAAKAHLLYLDGENSAGDDFLAEFIKQAFFDAFVKCVAGAAAYDIAEVKRKHNARLTHNKTMIGVLCRAALAAIRQLDEGKNSAAMEFDQLDSDILDDWLKDCGIARASDAASIEITSADYKRILRESLRPVFKSMGVKILAFDCDLLLLSGKICELKAVRELVSEFAYMPPGAIINMAERMPDGMDVKMATVIGGANIAMHKLGIPGTQTVVEFNRASNLEDKFVYGVCIEGSMTGGNLAIVDALPQEGDAISISYSGQNVVLLRQRAGKAGAVCASHKISRRNKRMRVSGAVLITLRVASGNPVEIVDARGFWQNGEPCVPEEFECSPYGFVGGSHWLDSGKI